MRSSSSLIKTLSVTGQKFSKCLKNGSDRLRKGNLLRRPIAKSLVCTKRRETLFPRNVSLFKDSLVKSTQQTERSERLQELEERENAVLIKEMAAQNTNTKRALDLATEKGSSASLTVLSIHDLGLNLNKKEFLVTVSLRYNWPMGDIPFTCVIGKVFTVDRSIICK